MPKHSTIAPQVSSTALTTIDVTRVEQQIYIIRGQKVMLDRDLAKLYGVPTMRLNEAVRRNIQRFPEDFMFQMTADELRQWKAQFVTSEAERRGLRKCPLVFREHGIAMLSSVLHSERAIAVNIAIMRAFLRLREVLASNAELAHRIDELEQRTAYHDGQLMLLFDVIHNLVPAEEFPHRQVAGFIRDA